MTCPFWNRHTAALSPYVPGEQPRDRVFIKLNTNENPYPPSPAVGALLKSIDPEVLRLYPDPTCMHLRSALSEHWGLPVDCFFAGNGSDEVLALAFQAFFETAADGGQPILFPDVTYSFYPVYADMYQVPYETVPVQADFSIRPEDYLRPSGGVVLANPNAPTGCLLSGEALERILSYDPSRLVLIDEAYADFGEGTAVSLLAEYPNLLVVRTFSKSYSLAGLRVGYAVGSPDLTEGLARIRDCFNSYTVDTTAQLLAAAALRDDAYFTDCRDTLIRTRERTAAALREMGFDLTESKGNFLWAGLPGTGGEEIYTALRKEGILIRYFRQPRTADHVRITVGRPEEMETLIECLRTFIRNR